jgi:hypothetical protein
MSERKLLLLMTAEQTEAFTRGSDDGALWRGCRVPAGGHVPGGARRPEPPPRWRRIHDAPTSTISRRDRLGRIPKDGDRPLVAGCSCTGVSAFPRATATPRIPSPKADLVPEKPTLSCRLKVSGFGHSSGAAFPTVWTQTRYVRVSATGTATEDTARHRR